MRTEIAVLILTHICQKSISESHGEKKSWNLERKKQKQRKSYSCWKKKKNLCCGNLFQGTWNTSGNY